MTKKLSKKEYIETQSKPVRRLIYEYLKIAIIEGSYEPGDKLIDRVLAEDFNVSTTPVKEALRQLEKEGLINTIPRKGSFVADHIMSSIEEIAWLRAALEGVAARLASSRRTDEDIVKLNKVIDDMEIATKNQDMDKLRSYNTLFHDLILSTSKNSYIVNQIESVRVYDLYIRKEVLSNYMEHKNAYDEHLAIFKAIESKDGEQAETLMRKHIIRSAELITKHEI